MNYQIMIDINKCSGCGICELVCSLHNNRECNPEKSKIRVVRYEDDGTYSCVPVVCQQCEKPACKEACVTKAIYRDPGTNAVVINKQNCFGCKYCFMVCPFGGISIDRDRRVASKCDLCGGEPRCVEFCPKDALRYVRSDKIDITKRRAGVDRYVEELK